MAPRSDSNPTKDSPRPARRETGPSFSDAFGKPTLKPLPPRFEPTPKMTLKPLPPKFVKGKKS